MAKLFRKLLEEQGYRVFLDLKELHRGHFDLQLQEQIHSCTDIICVLTPDPTQSLHEKPDEQRYVEFDSAMRTALSKLRNRFEDLELCMMITNLAAIGFAP